MDGGIREGRDSGEHPGTVGGRQPLHLQASGARAGLPGGLPGYPTPIWAASALFLGPSDVHTHAPRHTRLLAHTCRHRWSRPRGRTSRGLQGSVGQMPAPGLCLVPPPTPSPPAQTAQGRHSSHRGLGVETTGSSEALSPHFKTPPSKMLLHFPGAQNRAPGREAFPQNEGETLLKRKRSADSAAVAVCRLFPVRDFFYSIFLAVIASLFAEGWERPSVSGTRPSPSSKCALCSVSGPTPTATTSISRVAHGTPPGALLALSPQPSPLGARLPGQVGLGAVRQQGSVLSPSGRGCDLWSS